MSKEHVWPEWARKVLPPERVGIVGYSVDRTAKPREYRNFLIYDYKVGAVCEDCNSHWMSRLETAVKPLVADMMRGKGCFLNHRDQRILAAWATLKMLVIQDAERGPRYMPEALCPQLYELRDKQRPPPGLRAYIAGYSGEHLPGSFTLTEFPALRLWAATFSIWKLVIQLCGRTDGSPLSSERHFPREVLPSLERILPPADKSFIWPPGPKLNEAGLFLLGGHV